MSIFSALFDQGKIYNFQQAFGVKDITTAEMQAAIRDWAQLYYQAEATPEEDPCQRLPVLVVSKITKAAFSEYQADSDSEDAKRILLELGRVKGKAVQQALIGGQSFLKPIFGQGGLTFSVIPRGSYLPLGRDERGNITDIGTAERTVEGRNSYTLLERRRVDAAGNLVIESKLYLSGDGQTLGVQVPLDTLEKYAGLLPELVLSGVGSIGLIPVRCPQENTVDGSPDAVSVYAPAAGLKERAKAGAESEDIEAVLDRLHALDQEMRGVLDGLFGDGLCEKIFGEMSLYASADGLPVWENFILAVIDLFDDSVKREAALSDKRIQKHVQKYHK